MSSQGDLEEEIKYKMSNKEKRLQKENKRLKKYAQHLPDCNLLAPFRVVTKNGKPVSCTCGLKQVLKGI